MESLLLRPPYEFVHISLEGLNEGFGNIYKEGPKKNNTLSKIAIFIAVTLPKSEIW